MGVLATLFESKKIATRNTVAGLNEKGKRNGDSLAVVGTGQVGTIEGIAEIAGRNAIKPGKAKTVVKNGQYQITAVNDAEIGGASARDMVMAFAAPPAAQA